MADVATTSAIGAVVAVAWPLVQACLDKPSWTPAKRRVLALAAAIVIAVAAWFSSNHPQQWALLVAQAAAYAGFIQTAFTVLKGVKVNGKSFLDWAGLLTPGGEALNPKGAE